VALFAVAFAVWSVCNYRLEDLKQNQADNMAISHMCRLSRTPAPTQLLDSATSTGKQQAEPFEGKVAVAQVTLNRVESGKFANTVCGVVYQKNVFYERVVCQFSLVL
jgi:hypothetical protein